MVATIILLAMTVVLFSSIFAWVTTFPAPAVQNTTQFSANLVLTTNQTYVKALQITHLAGPALSGNSLVYLKSAFHPTAPEFQGAITVSTYIPNPVTWNLGQVFNYTFPCPHGACQQPQLPDNITVLVVSNDQVVFSTILPGTLLSVPPFFVATAVSPSSPAVGGAFTITAYVSGNTGGGSVYVNLVNVPGLSVAYPVAQLMTYSAATNRWTFTVPASLTTVNGTFYAFVNITNPTGQSATAGVPIVLVSSGGSTAPTLSVAVVIIPQPPASPPDLRLLRGAGHLSRVRVEPRPQREVLGEPDPELSRRHADGVGRPIRVIRGALGSYDLGAVHRDRVQHDPRDLYCVDIQRLGCDQRGSDRDDRRQCAWRDFIRSRFADQRLGGDDARYPLFSHTTCPAAETCPFLNDTLYSNWTVATSFSCDIWANVSGVTRIRTPSRLLRSPRARTPIRWSGSGRQNPVGCLRRPEPTLS